MESIYIKNMVCDRCIASVRKIFEKNIVNPVVVELGEVKLETLLDGTALAKIEIDLKREGFELIDSATPILVIKIKSALVNLLGENEMPDDFKLSAFLVKKFPYDYSHLSRVFSRHEKDTIEHYFIRLRIEKAKELLTYKKQNVSEIAYDLGYTSIAHFSRQFKKHVGVSPNSFQSNPSGRNSIEDI